MAAQKKQLSLDANIVFDLAADKDFAHDFREIFQSKGYALVLPPTAVHELHVIFTDGDSAAERELARTALTHLKQWSIRPFDLDSAAEAIDRVRGFYSAEEQANASALLARTLNGIICQRLIPSTFKPRVPCLEIMKRNLGVQDAILSNDLHLLNGHIESASHEGMCSFDQYLMT